MVNTLRKHVQWVFCKEKLFNENRLEVHWKQDHSISRNKGLLPNGILLPASFPHPEPSWFNFSRCTQMAIDKLSINDQLIGNVPGSPPPGDTPNKDLIYPQETYRTCTPDWTKTKARRQVVWVENVWVESVWECNWIVQQASKVLRTMESIASISVRTRHSADSIVLPPNENMDKYTFQVCTAQFQSRIHPISRCHAKYPLWTRFRPRRW